MFRLKNNEKGFTLIELIIVMMVIGILVLLAVPRFGDFRDKTKVSQIQNDVKLIENLIAIDMAENINKGFMPESYTLGDGVTGAIKNYLIGSTGEVVDTKNMTVKWIGNDMSTQGPTKAKGLDIIRASGTKLNEENFYIVYIFRDSSFKVGYYGKDDLGEKWYKPNEDDEDDKDDKDNKDDK